MTNEIIQDCSSANNIEIVNFVYNLSIDIAHLSRYLKKYYPNISEEIVKRTQFLDTNINIRARLYCLQNNISQTPTCQNESCTNHVKWDSELKQFNKYCSVKCCHSDAKFHFNIKQSNLKKYGVEHPQSLDCIKNKSKSTMLKRYGVEHYSQSNDWKDKCRNTSIARYGVEHPQTLDSVKQKTKHTNIAKYGVEYPIQLEEVKDKRRNTNISKYGVSHLMKDGNFNKQCQVKYRQTCIEKYNVDHSSKSQQVRDKIAQTQNSIETRNKYKATCLERYGVENYSQTDEFSKKCHKRYTNPKYPDMTFMTSWEFKVYDFLKEHDIEFEYQLEPIPYEYDGKTYYYVPDFFVNGRIYEVKGDMFFRINETTGKEEMFCPWRYDDWSDDKYNWECGKVEAKHQCMIANNVIILRKNEIDNLSIELFNP